MEKIGKKDNSVFIISLVVSIGFALWGIVSPGVFGDVANAAWKGNPFLDKFIPNKNILSKYCLSY